MSFFCRLSFGLCLTVNTESHQQLFLHRLEHTTMHAHTYRHLVTHLEPKGQRPCVFFLSPSPSPTYTHTHWVMFVYFLSCTKQACINIWASSQCEHRETPTQFKIIDWSTVLIDTCASFPHWIKVLFEKRNICKQAVELFILNDLRWKCFIGVSRWNLKIPFYYGLMGNNII